jgi:8-oxo-dGTP pyrophosphatase MutT (NUDIX family)
MLMAVESPGTSDAIPAPVQAASVLVLRPCVGAAEVLIVRRHPSLRFLGGYWVFPGGVIDAADAGTPTAGKEPAANGPSPALRVCAARELFEETGLLVAALMNSPLGAPPQLPATQQHEISRRNSPGQFAKLLRRQNAAVDLQSFQPWAHWITPSVLRRRFDTWFFIVAAPADQAVQIDGAEIDDVRWIQPVEWAFAARVTDFPVTPPTQLVLRELAHEVEARGSLESLLAAAAAGRSVPTVLPKLVGGDTGTVVLPWDPEYNELPGEGSPWDAEAIAARSGWPSRLPARVGKAQ